MDDAAFDSVFKNVTFHVSITELHEGFVKVSFNLLIYNVITYAITVYSDLEYSAD